MQSETIGKLSQALTKLQSELSTVLKTEDGELSRYKYADLESCVTAAKSLLAECGLSICQTMGYVHDPVDGLVDTLKTQLTHSSGEWIRGEQLLYLTKKAKGGGIYESLDSQTQGGAITYARRYGFCAILNMVQADDDGQQATNSQRRNVVEGPEPLPKQNGAVNVAAQPRHAANQDASVDTATSQQKNNTVPKEEWTAMLAEADKNGWPLELCKLSIEQEERKGRHADERSLFNFAKAKYSKPNPNGVTV